MPQFTKEIKRRIKSVSNTKKITKAMEMISAAKMRKSVDATLSSRFYARSAWEVLTRLAASNAEITHPLLISRPVKKIGILLITSDRGLCGSYNALIIKKTIEFLRDLKKMGRLVNVEFICVGKKGAEVIKKIGEKVVAVFAGLKDRPGLRDVKPISEFILNEYRDAKYDQILASYTDYFSLIKQNAKIKQLLPISEIDLESFIGDLDTGYSKKSVSPEFKSSEYILEPNEQGLLNEILPKFVEMQIYQMILESKASENSARMMAMRSATDAASDMISELVLLYNKARQGGITQEIAEIAGGRAALEQIF